MTLLIDSLLRYTLNWYLLVDARSSGLLKWCLRFHYDKIVETYTMFNKFAHVTMENLSEKGIVFQQDRDL